MSLSDSSGTEPGSPRVNVSLKENIALHSATLAAVSMEAEKTDEKEGHGIWTHTFYPANWSSRKEVWEELQAFFPPRVDSLFYKIVNFIATDWF